MFIWPGFGGVGANSMPMNYDGSLLYSLTNNKPPQTPIESEIINTNTGSKRLIRWPMNNKITEEPVASTDFRFIAHAIRTQYAYYDEKKDVFGVAVFTQNGIFQIKDKNEGIQKRTLKPLGVNNAGTLYTTDSVVGAPNADNIIILRYINGTYRHENPLRINEFEIRKIG